MNAILKEVTGLASERDARIELAAFYRLVEHLGWGEGVYNHIASRVPGSQYEFLIKPHRQLYDEVTASTLMKVDSRDAVNDDSGVNKVGFTTHAPLMRERPDIGCSVHIHTTPIMAMSSHPGGLRMLCQHAVHFFDNIAYDDFSGFAETVDQQRQILQAIADKRVLVMRNHGALIADKTVEATFTSLLRLVRACEVQLMLEAAGQGAIEISAAEAARSAEQFRRHDTGRGGADWPAWLRRLDRIDDSYRN